MASLGHIAVGMAAARVSRKDATPAWVPMVAWSALSLLPDADVIGFAFGVDYAAAWGHRGATHSLVFAGAVGLAIGLAARALERSRARVAAIAFAVLASHILLDMMTDGGLGCALFWPFDATRYFAPWRPLPVAPIGLGFLSGQGVFVALAELVVFAPVLYFALGVSRRRHRPAAAGLAAAMWLVLTWLLVSGDRVRDEVLAVLLREDTVQAPGFSEWAFRSVESGTSETEVRSLLGDPLGENWLYPQKGRASAEMSAAALAAECHAVRFENSRLVSSRTRDACSALGIREGASPAEVEQRLGPPPERCWQYTRSRGGGRHRLRLVCFTGVTVTTVIRQWE